MLQILGVGDIAWDKILLSSKRGPTWYFSTSSFFAGLGWRLDRSWFELTWTLHGLI